MDHQTKKRNRDQLDADQENVQSNSSVFPRFLMIESTVPDQPLSKLSPFVIQKVLKGLVGSPDLADISKEEITMELADQNVTATRRITVFRDGVRRPTNTLVLTFGTAILPKSLTVGYLKVAVDVQCIHTEPITVL